jgi:hypothetical protein
MRLLALLSVSSFGLIVAQEIPLLKAVKFDTSRTYRTSVCDRQLQLRNNSIQFRNALRGLNLTVAVTNYQYTFGTPEYDFSEYFSLDPVTGGIKESGYPGIYVIIMDEVARRAGFDWRSQFAAYLPLDPATDGNKSWTDILQWATETFDISLENWGITTLRMSMGISFPSGWYDSSIVLAERIDAGSTKRVLNLWSFVMPFKFRLWVIIFLSMFFTGIVYWLLEYMDTDADERHLETQPLGSIFYSAIVFTGHLDLRPNTTSARILAFSWTFWVMIVAAAYTANMASFLVSRRVTVYKYSTIQDVLRLDASLCVQDSSAIHGILQRKYPTLRLIPKSSEQEIYGSLRLPPDQGGCDAAAHDYYAYLLFRRNNDVNYDCSLATEGKVVEVVRAGMATTVDTEKYCTSLVSHVLDYHLTIMMDDGFIEQAWSNHIDRLSTVECTKDQVAASNKVTSTYRLGLHDVGGIFILHGIVSVAALSLAIFQYYKHPRTP